ncbi:helix-turn-helix domain-containing protein [Nodularia sp. NIES-3585]|uniref:helix-turn-helix domain-containing protein n=1 Tax=Nodularia sp. NIES-3585 TaxID=1973477 RepID=UPI000B70A787|nr:helix-turn-helix domain-containing protein [Nodularia sp. NIES-3585]GAX38935.1 hypothetical protein NIES3585_49870 [Nodularia sp. NIES-3585]
MSLTENLINNRSNFGAFIPAFLDDYPLTPEEFRVYAHIQRRSGSSGCFESIPNMSKHCFMAQKTTRNAIKLLLATGMIQIHDRPGTTNIYALTPANEWVNPDRVAIVRAQIKMKKDSGGKNDPCQKCTGVNSDKGRDVNFARGRGVNFARGVVAILPDEGNPIKGIPVKVSPSIVSLNPEEEKKEREEKKAGFGFQIPEEPNSSSRASLRDATRTLSEKTETSELTNKPVMEANVPPPPPDPFFNNRRTNPKNIAWDWLPEGPWRNEDGKLDTEFQIALASRWMKEYGGDLHVNKAKVLKHFRNDPTNLPIEWECYQSTFVHRVVNIQTRRSHGMDTTREEQQIAQQARAAIPLPEQMRVSQPQTSTEVVEQVASYALPHLQQKVDSIAPAQQPGIETSALEPPTDEFGAINPDAYSTQSATPEEIKFWANFQPNVVPISQKQPVDNQELKAAKAAIEALKAKKTEKSQKLTSLTQIIQPPVLDEEAVLQDMRKYLNSGSDVLRQIAIDWASDPKNQCQLVKVNGRVVDIKWVDF